MFQERLEMMYPQETQWIKESFDRDGYVLIRSFLSAQEVEVVSQQVNKYVQEVLPTLDHKAAMYDDRSNPDTIKQIPNLEEHDEFFNSLLSSDRFVKLAELMLDGLVNPIDIQWFDKAPGKGKPTPPHQDGFYFMLEPNEAITMWLALDEVDDDNGCVRYIPGSHRMGMRSHGRTDLVGFSQAISDYDVADREMEVSTRLSPGDLIVHHSMTIHTAGGNTTSDRHRRALGLVYYSQRAQQDKSRFKAYQETLTAELVEQGKL